MLLLLTTGTVFNIVKRARAHKLTLQVSVSMAMISCLYLLHALPHVANKQSFESLEDEMLNTSDLSSLQIERERKKV